MQGRRGWAKEHEALKGYRAEMQEKARQFMPLTEEDLKATGTHRQPLAATHVRAFKASHAQQIVGGAAEAAREFCCVSLHL